MSIMTAVRELRTVIRHLRKAGKDSLALQLERIADIIEHHDAVSMGPARANEVINSDNADTKRFRALVSFQAVFPNTPQAMVVSADGRSFYSGVPGTNKLDALRAAVDAATSPEPPKTHGR